MDEILTIDSDTSDSDTSGSDLEIVNVKVSKQNQHSKEVLLSHKQKKNIVTLLKDSKIHLPKGSVIRARQTCVSSIIKNIDTNVLYSVSIDGRRLPELNTKLISNKAVKEFEILSVSSSDESDEENEDLLERRVHSLGFTRKVLDTRSDRVANNKLIDDVDLSPVRFARKRSSYSLLPQKTLNAVPTFANNTKASTLVRSSTYNVPNSNKSDLEIKFPDELSLEQSNISPVPIGTGDSTVSTPTSNAIHSAEDPSGLILVPSVLFSPISLSPSSSSSSQDPISCLSRSVTPKSNLVPSEDDNVLTFSPISLTSSSNHSSQSTTQVISSSSVKNKTLQVYQESTPPPSKTPHNSSPRINNFDIRQEVLMECWTISHLSLSLVIRLLKEFGGKTNLLETLEVKEELERLVTSTAPKHNEVDDGKCLNGKATMMAALGLCEIDMLPLLVEQQKKRKEEWRGKKSLRTRTKKNSKAISRVKKGRKKKYNNYFHIN